MESHDELALQEKAFNNFICLGEKCDRCRLLTYIQREDADINAKKSFGVTCLYVACYKKDEEVVGLLLTHPHIEKNIIITDSLNQERTSLMKACGRTKESIVALFLQQPDVDINIESSGGRTALTEACASNISNPRTVSLLLARDDLDMKKEHGNSNAILGAARHARSDILNLLCASEKVHKDKKDDLNKNFFYLFVTSDVSPGNPLALTFFNAFDEDQKKAFLSNQLFESIHVLSCKYNHFRDNIDVFVQVCKQHGADLNTRNDEGKRPVDAAEDEYNTLKADLLDNSDNNYKKIIWKQHILHTFLRHTPCMSDGELFLILKQKIDIDNIMRVIFYYYYMLTIERDIALAMPTEPQKYRDKCKEQSIAELRNQLLENKLKLLGINS